MAAAITPDSGAGQALLRQWNGNNLPAIRRLVPGTRGTPAARRPVRHLPAALGGQAAGGWPGAEARAVPGHEPGTARRPGAKGLPGSCPGSAARPRPLRGRSRRRDPLMTSWGGAGQPCWR